MPQLVRRQSPTPPGFVEQAASESRISERERKLYIAFGVSASLNVFMFFGALTFSTLLLR